MLRDHWPGHVASAPLGPAACAQEVGNIWFQKPGMGLERVPALPVQHPRALCTSRRYTQSRSVGVCAVASSMASEPVRAAHLGSPHSRAMPPESLRRLSGISASGSIACVRRIPSVQTVSADKCGASAFSCRLFRSQLCLAQKAHLQPAHSTAASGSAAGNSHSEADVSMSPGQPHR